MAREATSGELVLFRTPGQWSKVYAAIYEPNIVYQARINQTFSSVDGVLEIAYDNGSGTLSDVLPDMMVWIGTTAGKHDVGVCRLRDKSATIFYIAETSHIAFADNLYVSIVDLFALFAKPVQIDGSGVAYMDGGVAYTNQHVNFDPTPIMGPNLVLKMTGASIGHTFDFSASYVFDSSISAYAISAPGSSSITGGTTATPTVTWNTTGWKKIYLTLTAANGKSFFGVRYIYIYNDANPPPKVVLENMPRVDAESGGWEWSMTLYDGVDIESVYDHALVIVFEEARYGATAGSIGSVAGAENILAVGYIAREGIDWQPEAGKVALTCYGAHYFFGHIPAWPDGVRLVTSTPTSWTQMQNLTVDRGVWHLLHWRSTATRMMDVFLTGDTRYTARVESLAGTLWEQLREMAWAQIYARAGVNAQGQFYLSIHPQLTDAALVTVMTITQEDMAAGIEFERVTMEEVSILDLSGISVNSAGVGSALFALAPGHAHSDYGGMEIQNQLLLSSQSQANTLAARYRAWRNNPYPEIEIVLSANNRLIDCFPNQRCLINIAALDTPRGIEYNGGLIPKSIALVYEDGYLHTEVTFEAQAIPGLAVNGDFPGSGDVSEPPDISFPDSPPFDILIPGGEEPSEGGAKTALFHDVAQGFFYTTTFDTSPAWLAMNGGLTTTQKQIANFFFRTPNGACHCGRMQEDNGGFVARAASLGAAWTVLYETGIRRVHGAAYNPLVPETVGLILQFTSDTVVKMYIGGGGSFAAGAVVTANGYNFGFGLSYGFGKWLASGYGNQTDGRVRLISQNGMTMEGVQTTPGDISVAQVRGGTTDITFHERQGDGLIIGTGNFAANTVNTDANIKFGPGVFNPYFDCDPTGQYMMTRYGAGGKGKSSDGGSSWQTLPSLPAGPWWFSYAGSNQRWVAGGGSAIRYTEDFGSTWINKEGNLTSVIPLPNIDMIKVLSY